MNKKAKKPMYRGLSHIIIIALLPMLLLAIF